MLETPPAYTDPPEPPWLDAFKTMLVWLLLVAVIAAGTFLVYTKG